jgi:hypothetical protein
MGRVVLFAAALLLLITAGLHALGLPMASSWGEGLGRQEHLAICLMWANASVGWGVVALLWALTAWRFRSWLGASAVAALLPAYGAAGVLYIDPAFFGGQMLLGSVVLGVAGIALMLRPKA